MTIELPDFLLDAADERTVRIDIAAALFERGYWSSGRAAEWVGMPTVAFWRELTKREVSRFDENDVLEDIKTSGPIRQTA